MERTPTTDRNEFMRNRPLQPGARVEPALLRRVNARNVLDALLELGPCTRTALRDHTGISAPTTSKLIDHLIGRGLVEEEPEPLLTTGRPSKVFRLARTTARVLGVVIDIGETKVFSCGLDGGIDDALVRAFPTPSNYGRLLSGVTREAGRLASENSAPCLGLGVSVPGLFNAREGRVMLSPNLRFLDGACLGADLEERLRLETILFQEEHALCLAEQVFGAARGLDDFAMIDISSGLGMGVVSGGRFVGGRDGYGGELGHITVDPRGELCGCGNRGCLETVATDRVFARVIGEKTGCPLSVDEAIVRVRSGEVRAGRELARMIGFLARGLGVVINLFNPAGVFVHGRFFDAREGLFEELVKAVGEHALKPSLAACPIVRSRGSKKQGAAAAVISNLFRIAGPSIQAS
jgi:predicted NBD/HSP70 family sugar kinase